jgi:hypothetical protein
MINSRKISWTGYVARMRTKRNACGIMVVKPEGKRLLTKPRHTWGDCIIQDLREIGWDGMDWIHLAQDRNRWWALVSTVMNLRVP